LTISDIKNANGSDMKSLMVGANGWSHSVDNSPIKIDFANLNTVLKEL